VWTSSESIQSGKYEVPLINLTIISYLFFSGIHWSQFMAFCQKINLLMVSTATYYRYLRKLIYPCTYDFWLQDQAKTINSILKNQSSGTAQGKFSGDGRFDSPGWSAKFCTYFIQDLGSRKVVALMVACKSQAGIKYSAAMEVFALRSLLTYLIGCGILIMFMVTDRSTTVRALMAEKFLSIGHEFDSWHFTKGIKNKLLKASKLKSCSVLKPWIPSIVNMLWWSLATSKGCPETARQKVLSILHHVTNCHHFPSFHLFGKCEHGDIVEKKPWIHPNSKAMQKLRTAICGEDNRNLDDLKFMTECLNTSDLESINNLQLKYANKKYSYSWLGMVLRACLCALDWNFNVDRPRKKDASGKDMYREKVNRYGDSRTVVPVLVPKDTSWQDKIFDYCVDSLERNRIPHNEFPIEALSNKRPADFSKEEAISKQETRMKKQKK